MMLKSNELDFLQKCHVLGTPLSNKNPLSKTKTNRFSDFFSIGCQGYVSGGLLRDTFFKSKFYLYKSGSISIKFGDNVHKGANFNAM